MDFTIGSAVGPFAAGDVLSVYPERLLTPGASPPASAVVATGTVQDDGSVDLTGLAPETRYVVGKVVGSVFRFVGILTGPVTNPVLVDNGSASAPSISFASDPDTGWFRLGANKMAAVTAGVVRMYVNSDGSIVVPDAAAGDPLSLGSGTSPGSIILGYNRAYRVINAAKNGTIRMLIANSQDEIAIGSDAAEGGPDASIVLRNAVTQFMRGGAQRLGVTTAGAQVTGALTVSTTLGVTGAATLGSTLAVTGAATFSDTVAATGVVSSAAALEGAKGQAPGATAFTTQASGDSTYRIEIRNNGTIVFGDGAGNNTSFASVGANLLRTSGKLLATAGLGVGNSAAATTPGTVTKKIEVFDGSGASLGFLAVYGSIS